MIIKNNYFYIFLLVLTSILTIIAFKEWFNPLAILSKGDWGFYFKNSLDSVRIDYFSTWLPDGSFGRVVLDLGQAPSYSLYGFFSKYLNIPFQISEKIIHFIPALLFSLLGSYLLGRKILKDDVASLVCSIIYTFNTYTLDLFSGNPTSAASFSMFPVLFYFLIIFIENPSFSLGSLFSIFISVSFAYEPRSAYVMGFGMIIYLASYFISRKELSDTLYQIKWLLLPLLLTILINIYWIISLIKTSSFTNNILFSRGLFGNNYWTLLHSIAFHFPWWTYFGITVFQDQPIPIIFFLLPILAVTGLSLNKNNPKIVPFAVVALVGILLSKQSDQPFINLYIWLYKNFPGFNAYRVATPFYSFINIGYSILISSVVSFIWKKEIRFKANYICKSFITFIISGLFLVNLLPLITMKIGTLFVPRLIPNEYLSLNNYIENQPGFFRVMWLPLASRWGEDSSIHPKISYVNALEYSWTEINEENRDSLAWPFKDQITISLEKSYMQTLLNDSSVKYIVVPISDVSNDDNFFLDYGGEYDTNIRNYYISLLDSIPYLKRINTNSGDVVVYVNNAYKPYISSLTSINGFSSVKNLERKYNFVKNNSASDFSYKIIDQTNSTPTTNIYNVFEDVLVSNIASSTIIRSFVGLDSFNNYYLPKENNGIKFTSLNNKVDVSYTGTTTFTNLISNYSFENGSWQNQVGDCNNYDSNSKIGMKIVNSGTDGNNALELMSTTHIACVSTNINVNKGDQYLFSFDYKSNNADNAGYYFSFDNGDPISAQIPVVDNNWHSYSKIIKVPDNSSVSSLNIYSYSKDGSSSINTFYDNFHLIEIPENLNNVWLVSKKSENINQSPVITYQDSSPTKKLVHIKGANTGFFLAMSESWHPSWQLEMNNEKIHGLLSSWSPLSHPDKVPDDQHFELDGFLNGWYVDVHQLCEVQHVQGCTKNADGSYDLEMEIEFWPQRWFYVGLVISGTTLAAVLGYLGYAGVVSLQRRRHRHIAEQTRV